MKITFVSNYLNHHQIPFCLAMQQLCSHQFYFVALQPMSKSRTKMGWAFEERYDFEIKAWQNAENKALAVKLIDESDVVVFGGGPYAPLMHQRIMQNKLTFLYSERVYKKGVCRFISPRGQYYMRRDNTRYKNDNLYLLAASAYAPFDYALVGAYKNKAFKWGYFPQTNTYDLEHLFAGKRHKTIELLWVSRFIPLKHPEKVLLVAERLKKDGYHFHISLIGSGPLQKQIMEESKKRNLLGNISFLGTMLPEQVREHMEKANIFLFTSDYNEGWGAVLNEAMNSGCAVVASHAIGAVPYLIKHGENGLIYKNGSDIDLYRQVKRLMDNPDYRDRLGKHAYQTITKEWNAENAAQNLFELCDCFLNNKPIPNRAGPAGKASVIPQWKMYAVSCKGKGVE